MRRLVVQLVFITLGLTVSSFGVAGGKLLATAGVTQVEGSAGGGLVPWAIIAGYDTRDEISFSAHSTRVFLDDYTLQTYGIASGFYDRMEISAAHQRFELDSLGGEIRQSSLGAKWRIYGDVIYSQFPQLSAGLLYKKLHDKDIADAVGAEKSNDDIEFYVAVTKVQLGLAGGYNLLWNYTLRYSRSNELGFLGYGSADRTGRDFQHESSIGILLSRHFMVGAEFRKKDDRLNIGEEHWKDVFIAYVPNKQWNVTLAWAELGSIAGSEEQNGVYLSLTGYPK